MRISNILLYAPFLASGEIFYFFFKRKRFSPPTEIMPFKFK